MSGPNKSAMKCQDKGAPNIAMRNTLWPLLMAFVVSPLAWGADQIGLKNFRELPAAYEEATHVSTEVPAVQVVYKKVLTRLPIRGQVEEMSSPMILAVAELAGAYCQELVNREAAKPAAERESFSSVKFDKNLAQFNPMGQRRLIDEVALLFWQRTTTGAEADRFLTSWSEFAAVGTTAADTGRWVRTLCSQFGTSLEFLAKR